MLAIVGGMASGCASPSIERVTFPPTDKASLVTTDQLLTGAVLQGRVEGLSCQKGPFDKLPSQDDATDRMREEAASIGATGIYHVRYLKGGISLSPHCWQSVTAVGIAYRMEK